MALTFLVVAPDLRASRWSSRIAGCNGRSTLPLDVCVGMALAGARQTRLHVAVLAIVEHDTVQCFARAWPKRGCVNIIVFVFSQNPSPSKDTSRNVTLRRREPGLRELLLLWARTLMDHRKSDPRNSWIGMHNVERQTNATIDNKIRGTCKVWQLKGVGNDTYIL